MAGNDDNQLVFDFAIDDKSVSDAFDKVEKEGDKKAKTLTEKFSEAFKNAFSDDTLKNVVLLNQGLDLLGKGLGLVKEGFKAIGEGAELIKKQEQVAAINNQFEILATRALGAGNDLRDGLVEAGKGLVETEDLLKVSNEALLALGSNAKKLPELFEVARKATAVFGGTALQNFQEINNAITTGTGRGLIKQLGIDAEVTFKKFADGAKKPLGDLTLLEKQQALIEAILTKTGSTLGGVDLKLKEATFSFVRLGVASEEAGKGLANAFSFFFKGTFVAASSLATDALTQFSNFLNANFATGPQKAEAQLNRLKQAIVDLEGVANFQKFNVSFGLLSPEQLEITNKQLVEAKKNLSDFLQIQRIAEDDARKAAARRGDIPAGVAAAILPPDPKIVAERNAKFQSAFLQAEQSNLQLQIAAADQIFNEKQKNAQLDRLANGQKELEESQHLFKISELNRQFNIEHTLSQAQYNALNNQENIRNVLAIEAIEEASTKRRLAKQRELQTALKGVIIGGLSTTFQGIGVALQKGENLFDAFGKGIVGIVGDMLIKMGEALIVQGLALEDFIDALTTLLPGSGLAAAAAGAGLIIFGSALKASVGAGAGSSSSFGGSSGGGEAAAPGATSAFTPPEDQKPQAAGTNVILNVNGNIIPRDRNFALELSDLVREAFQNQGAVSVAGNT